MPGDVLIPNMFAKIYMDHDSSYIAFSSSALLYLITQRSGGCLDGVCGCQTVSGSYLEVSGRCLGEYRCHMYHKQLNRSRDIKLMPFLPVTSLG